MSSDPAIRQSTIVDAGNDGGSYTPSWQQYVSWAGTAGYAFVEYTNRFLRRWLNQDMIERKTVEKAYRINDRGRVLKRSLKEHECCFRSNGDRFVPWLVVERLKNEAACMKYIREHTRIPVPRVLEEYEKDGSFHLWIEYVPGIEMHKLSSEEQSTVMPQGKLWSGILPSVLTCIVQDIVADLQKLRSRVSGGPTGILAPPSTVYSHHFTDFKQQSSPEEEFVFCHGDLSQRNILVDPQTLHIVAIIDWEYGGFYPKEHEIPYYTSPEYSGRQNKQDKYRLVVEGIVEFWRQSQISVA